VSNQAFLLDPSTGRIELISTDATASNKNGSIMSWVLQDQTEIAPSNAEQPQNTGSHDGDTAFAQWWTDHHQSNGTALSPSVLAAEGATIYMARHNNTVSKGQSTGDAGSCTLTVLRITGSESNHGAHLQVQHVRSEPVPLPGNAVALNADEHKELLTLTLDTGATIVYSTADPSLMARCQHHLSDRGTTELLNAHSSVGFQMRSAAKFHSAATRKLQSVTYGVNTTYRCAFAGLYGEFAPHYVDNTRYTNSLRPYDLLPVDSAPNGGASAGIAAAVRVQSSTALNTLSGSTPSEEYRTCVIYSVQSQRTTQPVPGSLIIWDIDAAEAQSESSGSMPSSNGVVNGHISSVARPQRLRVVTLPAADVVQICIAPPRWPASATATGASCFANRCPPRQAVLCLDGHGSLHYLRPQYRTDFPGPMYPIGYTLITKVVTYLEREDELDIPAGKGTTTAVNGSRGASASSLRHRTPSSTAMSVSGNTSTDSLVGLDLLLEEIDSQQVKSTPTLRGGIAERDNVSQLVCGTALTRSAAREAATRTPAPTTALPFTFADDWLRFPARASSSSAGVSSPAPAGHRHPSLDTPSSEVYSVERMDVDSDIAGAAANADRLSSVPSDAFTAGFEAYLPMPVKLQNGDFDAKLQRQRAAAEALRNTMTEPHRVAEKLRQIQDEAVAGAYRAAEQQEKKRQRSSALREVKAKQMAEAAVQKQAAQIAEQLRLSEERRLMTEQLRTAQAGPGAHNAYGSH
jgi:cation transport regulator ChaB